MGYQLPPPLVLMLGGTSLTAGRLATPDNPWTSYLLRAMRAHPDCKGEVVIINTGKGSQTSNFGATQSGLFAPLKPSHVLMEDFGINDCAIGPVSIEQATANFNTMCANYRAANQDVVIVHQTMSPASAGDANRTNLAEYYDNGTANAAINDVLTIDNYASWPKPLQTAQTVAGDDLHPLWIGTGPVDAFAAYSYPNIWAWAQQAMADYWG